MVAPSSSRIDAPPPASGVAVPVSRLLPVRLATNWSAGRASSSAGIPSWRRRPSRMTPTRSASAAASVKSWVTSSVGIASSASSSASCSRTLSRVWASSAESGSSSSRTEGSRASARATATRWRSPPDEPSGLLAGEVRDAEALEQVLDPPASAEADVRGDRHVREQRVVLEHEADRPPVGRPVDTALGVEPRLLTERDAAARGLVQAGDAAQHRRLARSGRSDERERLGADGQVDVDAEGAKRGVDVELELRQCERSLYDNRTAPLRTTSRMPIAIATSKSASSCS